ncbi:hypothetical protein PAMA_001633 [Pampus argenteus]
MITVCIMEKHQAGQKETLVEVEMDYARLDSLDVVRRSRGPPTAHTGCFRCVVALAAAMGLVIVAGVAGFILHVFMFESSCGQEAELPSNTAKVNMTCTLKESDEKGRYNIFTVDKTATYLIYGWVTLSDTSEEVILMQMWENRNRTLQKKQSKTESFFFVKVKLASNSRISIYFKSTCTDSSFHVYEL